MFEKEAEEIMRQNGCRTHSGNFIQADKVCELIQKGAEFGYNKGRNEAKETIKQLMKAIPYGSGKLATESYDKAEQFLKNNA